MDEDQQRDGFVHGDSDSCEHSYTKIGKFLPELAVRSLEARFFQAKIWKDQTNPNGIKESETHSGMSSG